MPQVKLYSRPGCRLCDRAHKELLAAAPDLRVDKIDVDSDPRLRDRYGLDIPVAVVGERELFRHRFDPACLDLIPGAH